MTKEDRKAIAEHCDRMSKACEHDSWEKCAKAMKASHDQLAEHFTKSAGDELHDGSTEKAATQAIDALRSDFQKKMGEFEKTLIPTAAHGVLPSIPDGLQMLNRAGGATPPTDVSQIAPEFQKLFAE
ncbi:MAG: hypothetical protein WA690_03145 [Candidatus Acidiferrales bacterium]